MSVNKAMTPVLIFGMHRSGTSAMASLCQRAGMCLGEHLAPPAEDNPKGFFEDQRVMLAHDLLLRRLGLGWDYPGEMPPDWLLSADAEACGKALSGVARQIAKGNALWGIKDPRISRLLPLWQEIFTRWGVLPRCIILLRNPLEIAASLQRRDDFSQEESLWLWCAYLLDAERHTRGYRRVFVTYESLLNDPLQCLRDVGQALDISWPVALKTLRQDMEQFIEPGLRQPGISTIS